MSIRRWSSFLERDCCKNWQQFCSLLIYEIEDDSSSSSLSSNSSFSSNDSENGEDNDDDLLDAFHVAFHNANVISRELAQNISHPNIRWHWKSGLCIDDLSSDDALSFFRFRKVHLQEVSDKIWPRLSPYLIGTKEKIVFGDGHYSAPYETLLLLMKYRLSRPHRIRRDTEQFFGFRRSKICAGLKAMAFAVYSLSVSYLSDPTLFHHRMPRYAEIISAKCGLVSNVWGFLDGTLRRTCRPTYHQKQMYSGHKRTHGMKFQSVVTPDGLFACMFGAICGNCHDSHMLTRSGLLPALCNLMPVEMVPLGGTLYSLYADPAYPQSAHIFGGFRNPAAGSREELWNTQMSSVCESVEWGFAYINRHWSFLNFPSALKLFQSPIAKYYMIATFFCNLRTCYYGNQTMSYFECGKDALTIDEYLALVD